MRTKLLSCMAVLAAGCVTEPVASTDQPIVGGTLTPAGKYPATGALVAEVNGTRQVFCTGTLIAPDAVLTAGHCMIAPPYIGDFTPEFTLALDANTAPDSEIYPSRAHYTHPMFDPNTSPPGALSHAYDLAIVLLAQPIPNAEVAYLPTDAESAALAAGIPLEITGYGQT
ncbi:MAG: S1 family peptidase, partial [Acidobacteriota bacterium]